MATEADHVLDIITELMTIEPDFKPQDLENKWLVKELASTRARLDKLEKGNVEKI